MDTETTTCDYCDTFVNQYFPAPHPDCEKHGWLAQRVEALERRSAFWYQEFRAMSHAFSEHLSKCQCQPDHHHG